MKPRFMPVTQARDAREAAYLAALAAERDQGFISDTLQEWARTKKPSGSEMCVRPVCSTPCAPLSPFTLPLRLVLTTHARPTTTPQLNPNANLYHYHRGLATLVASVACREAGSLDYAIRALAGDGPVRLKGRQRVVLRTALAQYKYCTHTPLYAIVDHAVGLAKRYGGGGGAFAGFTNALLRKLPPDAEEEEKGEEEREGGKKAARTRPLPLPEGDSVEAMAAALSFPPFLVRLFVEDFGLAGARRVMEASNTFPPTMARARAKDAAGKRECVGCLGEGGWRDEGIDSANPCTLPHAHQTNPNHTTQCPACRTTTTTTQPLPPPRPALTAAVTTRGCWSPSRRRHQHQHHHHHPPSSSSSSSSPWPPRTCPGPSRAPPLRLCLYLCPTPWAWCAPSSSCGG